MKQSNISLDSYFVNLIEESVKATLQKKALQEKEKQDSSTSSSNTDDSTNNSNSEVEKLKSGNVKVDDIVEKLNSIRSGKSLKDEKIAIALNSYFDALKKPEKVALLAFLKGIAQIVTGEIEGSKAADPGDNVSNIEMTKVDDLQKKSIKPVVIKAPEIEKKIKKSSEDTSGPVPISPKK